MGDIIDGLGELDVNVTAEVAVEHGQTTEEQFAATAELAFCVGSAVYRPDRVAIVTGRLAQWQALFEPAWQRQSGRMAVVGIGRFCRCLKRVGFDRNQLDWNQLVWVNGSGCGLGRRGGKSRQIIQI